MPTFAEIQTDENRNYNPSATVDTEKLLEFTRRYYTYFEREFEQLILQKIKENYQLMQGYDELLTRRMYRSNRIIRQTITIPKVQPEIFSRIAHEMSTILSGAPVFRCVPPKGADDEIRFRCGEIEDGINDLMDSDDWFMHYYNIKFWGSLCPFVAVNVDWAKDIKFVPTQETYQERLAQFDRNGYPALDQFGAQMYEDVNRLVLKEDVVRIGPKTRVFYPWECFFDYTAAKLLDVPLLFIRYLMSREELEERFDARVFSRPQKEDWAEEKRPSRNFGLEIIRSVPNRGTTISDTEWDRERFEVLSCYARTYEPSLGRMVVKNWWVLSREFVISEPSTEDYKLVEMPYLIYQTRPIPGTQMGIAPAESIKQIQRAADHLFNAALETIYYGLQPPTYLGEGVDFAEEHPTVGPGKFIPIAGTVKEVLQSAVPFSPDKVFAPLDYMDRKGMLASDVSDTILGQQKAGTPPTAMETGLAQQGAATKLGLFTLIDSYQFLRKWLELFYWMTLEKNPVLFSVRGRPYDLRWWVLPGGPQFDLPQVAEVSGRASEKVLLNAAAQVLMQNPLIVGDPARNLAFMEKWGYAQGYTWMKEVLYPNPNDLMPTPIRPETIAAFTALNGGGQKPQGKGKETENGD